MSGVQPRSKRVVKVGNVKHMDFDIVTYSIDILIAVFVAVALIVEKNEQIVFVVDKH